MNRRTRKQLRADNPVAVRVVCHLCGKFLAEMYGTVDGPHSFIDRHGDAGMLVGYGRSVIWRCANGHGFPYRTEKLTAAYAKATSLPPRERVIRLPHDVSGTA